MQIPRRALLATFVLGLCVACVATAQPAPTLGPTPPLALRRGQTIEPSLAGEHLAALASAAIENPGGVSITLVNPTKPDEHQVRVKITASPDASLGEHEVRLIGPTGVTRPLRVFVTAYPVVNETDQSNSDAQNVALPATLVGRIAAAGQVRRLRFEAVKDQRMIFDVHAARIASALAPVLTIHNADGRELRSTMEHHGGDPVLVFDPPEDGLYVLQLRDLQYRGGDTYDYWIDAGHIPYLEGVLPSSGEPGKVVEARAIGYNLEGGQTITIDVRSHTPLGESNAVPFEVTELPQVVESEPNDTPQQANSVSIPAEISGHVDRAGDEDFFKFHLAYKQAINLEVLAARFGSPVAPLLQLRNAKGDVMESNDGTPDADARIVRDLDAGDYVVSVRDLTYAGGPGYWYRLKIEPALRVPQDFAVLLIPDTLRLHRGGNVAIWCDVKRLNGFHGDVTVTPEDLPPGVSAQPVTLSETSSGWFTLAAVPDARLGSMPIRFRAAATVGTVPVAHEAHAETDGRDAGQGYLTVLEPAPFTVEAVAMMTPQRVEQMNGEIRSLASRLDTSDPEFDASLAKWEQKVSHRPVWTILNPSAVASAKSTSLQRQPDGSILATGSYPAQDDYTVTARTELKGITAIRLEVLADERLPNHGPGAAPNGNFVLSEFKVLASGKSHDPQPVALHNAWADFSQANFAVSAAIDGNPETGWAIDPQQGRSHVAVFQTTTPIGSEDETTLMFVLEHQSMFPQHNIGRFRISVTNAGPAELDSERELTPEILAIVAVPKQVRTGRQVSALADYFRTIDPQSRSERRRLEAMRGFIGPYAEMQRLQRAMRAGTPQLEAEQEQWEKSLAAGSGWSVLDINEAESSSGARLERQPDGSLLADGPNPPSDAYRLTAATSLKGITALRLEVLPDPRLPGNGPGRAEDGNFVLTRLRVIAAAKGTPAREISFRSAAASIEQKDFAVAGALDDKHGGGWGIAPASGQPAEATFYASAPITGDGPLALTIAIEQLSKLPQHTLGRFRIWVTTNPQPDAAFRPPQNIAAIVKTPSEARSPDQKRELAIYFRSIAPSLAPLRQRLADLQSMVPALPLRAQRNRPGAIPVPINRRGDFNGDVKVTLEGFVTGREGNNPAPITRELKLTPMTLGSGNVFGTLTFEPAGAETGTRMVVLKAEATVGNETIVEYSPAFPLTIENQPQRR